MAEELNFDEISKKIDVLLVGLDKLDKAIQKTGRDFTAFDKRFANTANFERFVGSLKLINKVDTSKFVAVANGVSGIATSLSKLKGNEAQTAIKVFSELPAAFVRLNELAKNTNLLKAVNAIAGITRAIIKLAEIQGLETARANVKIVGEITADLAEKLSKLGALKDINSTGIRSGINSIAALITGLARLSDVDISNVKIPPELIDTIQKLMQVVRGADGGAEKKVGVFKNVLNGVLSAFSTPIKAQGAQTAAQTAQTLATVAKALQSFSAVSLDSKQVNGIIKTFGKLSVAFQGIGLLLKFLPGGAEISEFSKTIQRLGIGMASLARASATLDLAAIRKLITALALLGVATKLLSKILNFKNDKSAEAFAKVIGSVATAMNAVAALNNIQIKSNKNLDGVIAPIVKIVTSFRKLKGVKVEGLGEVVKGIGDIIKSVSGPELDTKRLESLPGIIERIVNSLRNLNGVRVNSGTGGTGFKANDLTASVRAGLLQVQVINQIATAFQKLTRTVVEFADRGLVAFRNVSQQAVQLGESLVQQARRVQESFSLGAVQESSGLQLAQQFEQTSSRLQAAGLNDEELQRAQDFADVIGIQYPLSANQALESILALTKAGQDLSNVEFILPAAADLAALTDTGDLNLVTNTLIGVAGAFQDFTDDVEAGFSTIDTAANLIVGAADVSTASVESLSAGLANVGPTARTAGLSLEETLAILSQFEDANIRGAEAGTQLRSVLNSLSSARAQQELRRLNVATVNADGTIRDLNDVIVDINDAYEQLGFSESQRAASINLLGDSYARQGLNVLLLNDGYAATVEEMGNADTAAEKAAQSMDNLTGEQEQLRGSVETLLKEAFYPLINRVFRPITRLATNFVNALLTVPDPVKDIVSVIIQLVATFGTLVAGTLAVAGVISVIGGGMLGLAANVGLLILRLPLLVASVGAVTGAFLVALPAILAVSGGILALSTIVSDVYRSIEYNVDGAGDSFENFSTKISELQTQVTESFSEIGSAVRAVFGGLFNRQATSTGVRVASIFDLMSDRVEAITKSLRELTQSDIVAFLQSIAPYVGGLVTSFRNLGDGIFVFLTGGFDEGVEKIKRSVADIASIITDFIQNVTGLNLGTIITFFNEGDLRSGVNELFQSLVRIFQNAVRDNIPALRSAAEFLLQFLNPFNRAGSILQLFGFEEIGGALTEFGQQINRTLGGIVEVVARLFAGDRIQDIIGGSFGSALTGLFASIERLVRPIISLFERFFAVFQGRSARFGEIFDEQVGFLEQSIRNVTRFVNLLAYGLEQALGPITANLPAIIETIEAFAGRVISAFQPLVPFFEQVVGSFGRIFGSLVAVLSGQGNFGDVAAQIVSELIDTFTNLPRTIGDILVNLGDVFQSSLINGLGKSFQAGDVIGGILRFIGEVVGGAIRALPGLFRTLGDRLGLSFLTAIGDALSAGNLIRVAIIVLEQATRTIYYIFDQIGLVINGALTELADRALAGGDPITAAFLRIFGGIARLVTSILSAFQTDTLEIVQAILRIVDFLGTIPAILAGLAGAFLIFRSQIVTFVTTFIKNLGGLDFALARFQGVLRGFISQAVRFAGIAAIFIEVSAAFNRLANVLEGKENIFGGFLNFLVDVGAEALRLTGLDGVFAGLVGQLGDIFGIEIPESFDGIIASVRTTVDQLGQLFQIFIDNLGRDFRHGIDILLVSAADAIQRIKVAAGQGDASSDQFFAIGDTLAQQAELSAQQFFSTLGNAIENPQNSTTLNAQLRTGAEAILQEFTGFIADGGTVAQLAADGVLSDVVASLSASGTLDDAFAQLRGNMRDSFALFAQLTPEQQAENFGVFFDSIKEGTEASGPALLSILQLMDQLVASGDLTREQADIFRSQLTPSTEGAARVLDEYNTVAAQNTAEIEAMNAAANLFGYTLDGLQETFYDTTLSATQLGERFRDVVSGLTSEEINIGQLFDIFEQLSPEEAAASFGVFFEAAIRGGVARAGNEQYFAALQQQIEDLRASGAITSEQRRTFLDQMANEAQVASTALDATAGRLQNLKEKLRALKAGQGSFSEIFGLEIKPPKVGGGGSPAIDQPITDPTAGIGNYVDDTTAEVNEKIADFAYEESKRIKDDLKEEADAAAKIKELKSGVDQDELDRIAAFNLDTQRRAEDHEAKMLAIQNDSGESLDDAISERSAAAARIAIKERDKKLKDEQAQFDLNEKRRREDEDIRLKTYERERQEKIIQAEQDLVDLQIKNMEERLERQADFQRELQQLKDKNAQSAALQEQAVNTAASNWATMAADGVKTSSTVSLAMSRMSQAIRAQMESAAKGGGKGNTLGDLFGGGGKGKGGSGGRGNTLGQWDFSGLEVSGGYSNAGGNGAGGSGKFINDAVNNFLGGVGGGGGSSNPFAGNNNPFAKKMPLFETGGRVARSGMAWVDEDEVVLNQTDSERYLNSRGVGGGGSMGGAMTINVPITVQNAAGMNETMLVEAVERTMVPKIAAAIRNSRNR